MAMILNSALEFSDAGWRFDNTYARLPSTLHTRVEPSTVREPALLVFNRALAESMGLDAQCLESEEGAAIFSGNAIPAGAEPIAQAYAGHQFGHFNMLGDGRAILLGEHLGPDGARWDVQLKGAGRTAYSRRGDGRAALGPMLREYIISEAMQALGIPTTRSLAVTGTGEVVHREEELPGAVLVRIAASHIRVGTFEYAAMNGNVDSLKSLAEYTIRRHYPSAAAASNPFCALLDGVIERQASLISKWMLVGFIHGVMNTDNMALSGESIDYGPCAFMDAYDSATVFSSIDRNGRYAYSNQPGIAHWNLARLAEALLPLLDSDENTAVEMAKESLGIFPKSFHRHWVSGMRAKLGLFNEEAEDVSLIEALLDGMRRNKADYTNTFRNLDFNLTSSVDAAWHGDWKARLARQDRSAADVRQLMQRHNPAVIPRNHKVEEALDSAVGNGNFGVLNRLLDALANPFVEGAEKDGYREAAPAGSEGYRTFCGT